MNEVARELGPNTYLMGLILFGVGAAGWWFAQHILIPVRDQHCKFLDKLDGHLEKLNSEQEKLAENTATIVKQMDTIACRGQQYILQRESK
jgi:hypothetical protein